MIRRLAIVLIDIYKGFVSPRKGFNCAYRIGYGGDSCSSKIRAVISDEPTTKRRGMVQWMLLVLQLNVGRAHGSLSHEHKRT